MEPTAAPWRTEAEEKRLFILPQLKLQEIIAQGHRKAAAAMEKSTRIQKRNFN